MRHLVIVIIAAAFAAHCTTDPNRAKFPEYYAEARKILDAHTQASAQFRKFNVSDDNKDAAKAIKEVQRVTKGLRKLLEGAKRLNLSDASILQDMHNELVAGLGQKYEGYVMMIKAFKKTDSEMFEKARLKVLMGSKLIMKFEITLEEYRGTLGM